MTINDTPPMICQTCQRALDLLINDDGAHYVHTFTDPDEHRPLPVAPPVGWRGQCDFCAAGDPTHVLPARAFAMPGMPGDMTDENWAACAACANLIRNEHWDWLTARVIARFHAVYGYPMPTSGQQHLARLYHTLSLAVSGPLRPITDPPTETSRSAGDEHA